MRLPFQASLKRYSEVMTLWKCPEYSLTFRSNGVKSVIMVEQRVLVSSQKA